MTNHFDNIELCCYRILIGTRTRFRCLLWFGALLGHIGVQDLTTNI